MSCIYTFQMTHERVKKLKLRPFDFLSGIPEHDANFSIISTNDSIAGMLTAVLYCYGLTLFYMTFEKNAHL